MSLPPAFSKGYAPRKLALRKHAKVGIRTVFSALVGFRVFTVFAVFAFIAVFCCFCFPFFRGFHGFRVSAIFVVFVVFGDFVFRVFGFKIRLAHVTETKKKNNSHSNVCSQ